MSLKSIFNWGKIEFHLLFIENMVQLTTKLNWIELNRTYFYFNNMRNVYLSTFKIDLLELFVKIHCRNYIHRLLASRDDYQKVMFQTMSYDYFLILQQHINNISLPSNGVEWKKKWFIGNTNNSYANDNHLYQFELVWVNSMLAQSVRSRS